MRRISFPLVVKYTAFLVLFAGSIVGVIGAVLLRNQQQVLQQQLIAHGRALATTLQRQATDPLLTHDDLMLAIQVKEMMKNEGVVEAFIVDRDGRIRAHTDTFRCQQEFRAPDGGVAIAGGDEPIRLIALTEWIFDGDGGRNSGFASPPAERLYTHAGERLSRASETETRMYRKAREVEVLDISPSVRLPGADRSDPGQVIATLHLRLSKAVMDDAIASGRRRILQILAGVLVLSILVSVLVVRTMVRPIRLLVAGVRAIASGDLNQEIRLHRRDELGLLTDSFNEMAQSLREKEFYKDTLGRYVSKQVVDELRRDPTKLALGGTRRRAAVMFADIRGFTPMSERLKPEEVVSIINVYLQAMAHAVFHYDGTLDKFIGDCVMAVFGAPIERPDDSERAVRAAIEIQDSVSRINRERARAGQGTVDVGIGINFGDVVAGNMGAPERMDYTVIGDHVNLAARLESNSEGGQILVSEAVYQAVKEHFHLQTLEPIRVKGKSQPVQIYAVKDRVEGPHRSA